VGNHGVKSIGRTNDNFAAPFLMWSQPANSSGLSYSAVCVASPVPNNCNGNIFSSIVGAGGTAQPFAAKFPHLSNLTRIWGRDTSNYNGLQMTLTARNFHGLTVTTGYTYSKALSITDGNGSGLPADSNFTGLEYGRSGSDLRHKLSISPTYNLPSIMGFG